ncbi:MAG: radical SAM protein, partial [Candidatus Cloacimonetes bacterium]|nr:radical SAM protein [Candidatus Cloacimonadota bacterium]
MELSEIFYSIQGESSFSGLPCIFIRLAGCNLRCSYCDTKYAYQKNFELTVQEIIKKIREYSPVSLVEVTGGEPLLQVEIYLLLDELLKEGFNVLLETNGSILLDKVPEDVIKIVDIKTPSSNMSDKMNWGNIKYLYPYDEIKFVLSNRNDFDWAVKVITDYDLLKYKVLFSPVISRLEPKILSEWILELKMPIRLQMQLHKKVWGGQKG